MAYNTSIEFELIFSIKRVYTVKEDGWTHCRVKLKKQNGYEGDPLPSEFDAFGTFVNVFAGDEYKSTVQIKNGTYGYYLIVEAPELLVPHTAKALVKFLVKRCSGVGEKTIANAVDVIGTDIISKVAENPGLLDKLTGFTEKKKETFVSVCESNVYFEQLLLFVRSLKLPASVATKLYDRFQRVAIFYIKSNPYFLYATDDISFEVADKLAYEYGHVKWDDNRRLVCALRACVDDRAAVNGDTCVKQEELVNIVNSWILSHGAFPTISINEKGEPATKGFDSETIEKAINTLVSKSEFVRYLYNKEKIIFKKSFYTVETQLAQNINNWVTGENTMYVPENEVRKYISRKWKNLSKNQEDAVCMALGNKLSILTGGPGTGKTFTVNVVTDAIKKFYPKAKIMLMAPTGRAASRMSQGNNEKASTIHSALRIFQSEDNSSNMDDKFKLDVDYVIMDEASMTDEWLFNTFFNKLVPTASVLIVGDKDQLPSVSAGCVLRDLISCKKIPLTELNEIHRQSGVSNIVINAHKIKDGVPGEVLNIQFADFNNFKNDFSCIESNNEDQCRLEIINVIKNAVHSGISIEDLIVLAPMKKGILGVTELNSAIQNLLNPAINDDNPCVYKSGMKVIRIGDRVLQTKNNYEVGINNGSLGTVLDIGHNEKGEKYIEVEFDGEEEKKVFKNEHIKELELGYCITIHKSQGSEMKYVVIPSHESQEFMMNKKLLYTAMTRAKESFLCIGSTQLFKEKALVESSEERLTMLQDLIQKR